MSQPVVPDTADADFLSRPPSKGDILFDKSFRWLTLASAWTTIFFSFGYIVCKIGGQFGMLPQSVEVVLKNLIELLAASPSCQK